MPANQVLQQTLASGNQLGVDSLSVSGGILYVASIAGKPGTLESPAMVFVPSAVASTQRFLAITSAKSISGVPLTTAAGTGDFGIARTAGTDLLLQGETTSSNAKTDAAFFEFDLPDSYVAGADIPVTVACHVAGSGTFVGASSTMTVAVYTETNGVEAALAVSAAKELAAAVTELSFTITGTNLVPGQHLGLEITMLVTTAATGANTGYVDAVSFQA